MDLEFNLMHKWKLLNTSLPEAFPVYKVGVTTGFSGVKFKSTILCVRVFLLGFVWGLNFFFPPKEL